MGDGDQTEVQFPYSITSLSEEWVSEDPIPKAVQEQFFSGTDPRDKDRIVYSFYQPDVRRKLLALIKTDVIRILDKNFMLNLQEKLYQSYWDDFEKRLLKRRVAEGERRKKLALRGVQGLDDNSLDDHPIIQVAKQVEANMAAHRSKKKKGQEKERTDCWEYAQFQTMSDLESEKSEVSLLEEDLTDMDTWRKNVRKYENALEEALQIGLLPTEEVMENLKYEPPLVKQLRKLNGVEEMYDLADKILAIRGKSLND